MAWEKEDIQKGQCDFGAKDVLLLLCLLPDGWGALTGDSIIPTWSSWGTSSLGSDPRQLSLGPLLRKLR